jgi:16S rRNA (guanine527-N7)-methyltransferase
MALSLRLDPAQRLAIEGHVRLMLAWNAAINLTAVVEPSEIAVRHVVDSLTAAELIQQRQIDRVIDLGSGAGYPGIPLAIAVPLRELLVVESVAKKARFLATVADALSAGGLPTRFRVAAQRAEELANHASERDAWPAVIARAVAPLGDLIELAFPLLQPGGVLIAWKRGPVDAEIASGQRAAKALGGGRVEAIGVAAPPLVGHWLVVATRTGTVPPRFPRDPRVRRRRPW